MTEDEKAMLAEVARDARFRNNVREVEYKFFRGQIIGYLIAGVIIGIVLLVGWLVGH